MAPPGRILGAARALWDKVLEPHMKGKKNTWSNNTRKITA
jgi:hypothetical protein